MISLAYIREVEGRQVDVTLADGARLEDCRVVSVGRLWVRSVWLFKGETDLIVGSDEIADICVVEQGEAA
ncbi:MAG TPA: hypothetical protein VFV02_16820 [Acidimicrobiales bacterium]|nr:hypothetical protein [Acidimicrobiales bacterium]